MYIGIPYKGLIFLYYKFHDIKKYFISRLLRSSWFSLLSVIIHMWPRMFLCVMFPIFDIFYDCLDILVINLRTCTITILHNDKNVHLNCFLPQSNCIYNVRLTVLNCIHKDGTYLTHILAPNTTKQLIQLSGIQKHLTHITT